MATKTINTYFLDIDRLQFGVFEKIDEIVNFAKPSSEQSESLDERRSDLSKSANGLIRNIAGLLKVIEVQIRQENDANVSHDFLKEKLELYKDKVDYLKLKLKESQLVAFSLENEYTHKQRIEEYVKEEKEDENDIRDQLFAGKSQGLPNDNEHPVDEQILTQNKNITSTLKLTKQLMTMSVMQTELNIDNLDQQSRDLNTLNDKLVDLESVLVKSRQIVKFIEKQDKNDKRRIYLSIGFLLLCCAWVLWRRVLKLPVKILLWTLMKFFGVFSWITSKHPADDLILQSQGAPQYLASTSILLLSLVASEEPESSSYLHAAVEEEQYQNDAKDHLALQSDEENPDHYEQLQADGSFDGQDGTSTELTVPNREQEEPEAPDFVEDATEVLQAHHEIPEDAEEETETDTIAYEAEPLSEEVIPEGNSPVDVEEIISEEPVENEEAQEDFLQVSPEDEIEHFEHVEESAPVPEPEAFEEPEPETLEQPEPVEQPESVEESAPVVEIEDYIPDELPETIELVEENEIVEESEEPESIEEPQLEEVAPVEDVQPVEEIIESEKANSEPAQIIREHEVESPILEDSDASQPPIVEEYPDSVNEGQAEYVQNIEQELSPLTWDEVTEATHVMDEL